MIAGLLLVIAILALLVGLPEPINVYDEGITVYGAQRILQGDKPYVDFWTLYAPGQFYLVAGLFELFGPSILVERLWDTMVRSGLSVLTFLLTRTLAPTGVALVVWALTLLWLVHIGHFGYPVFPALLLTLLGFMCLVHAASHRHYVPWSIAAGALVGVAVWIRQDLGLYALLSVLLALGLARLAPARPGAHTGGEPLGILAQFSLGAGAVLLPAAIHLLTATTRDDLLHHLLVVPATVFPKVRALPYPPAVPDPAPLFSGQIPWATYLRQILEALPFYFPLVAYAAGLITIALRLARRQPAVESFFPCALLIVFGIMSLNQARIRSDLIHLPPTLIPAIVLMAALCYERPPGTRGIRGSLRSWLGLGCCALLFIQPVHGYVMKATRLLSARFPSPYKVERARGVRLDPDQAQAIAFIQRHVPPDRLIFVGNERHDRVVINDVAFCFLAERGSATRYHELHPGIATTVPVQREIVADLERKDVQYVILVSGLGNPNEPNESRRSSGVRILDDYLGSAFRPAETFGNYAVLRRR